MKVYYFTHKIEKKNRKKNIVYFEAFFFKLPTAIFKHSKALWNDIITCAVNVSLYLYYNYEKYA